jgi:glycosyltransferase involved in cell wall biosynthesis
MAGTRDTRVLHLSPALFDDDDRLVGGGERYAFELARHMAEVCPTRLVAFGADARAEAVGAMALRLYGGTWNGARGAHDPLDVRAVMREVRAASVVHCHQRNYRLSKFAALAANALRKPVFVTDHGGGHWGPGVWIPDRGLFDGHLFVSEFSRRANPPPRGARAAVIYGGVDHVRFAPAPRVREDAALFVGRLLPHKGVDVLIEALPAGMSLRVVGQGVDERYYRDLRKLAAGRPIQFHHDWDDERLADGYRRARCAVLPSVYVDRYGDRTAVPELLGQALLEAMASGTPVVCSDAGGMPEIVRDGVTGFVVASNDVGGLRDRLALLHRDDDLVETMGRAARAEVERRFTWAATAQRCLSLYRELGR